MIVRNKIWEEAQQAYANVLCLRWYTDRQRACNRYYHLFIATVASVGTFGYIFSDKFPLVSSIIIAVVSLIKSIFPHFLQPERELCVLDGIMDFYNTYLIEMETFFYQLDHEIISEEEMVEMLRDKKIEESEKQSTFNRLVRHIPSKKNHKFQSESIAYANRVYFNKYEESK